MILPIRLNALSVPAASPVYLVEGLVVLTCVLYLWGMPGIGTSPNLHMRTRLLSFLGLCATGSLVFIGLLSPYYGVVAFLAIPAPIVFLTMAFRPALMWKRPKLRLYLHICVVASALVWVFQIFWQLWKWR